MEKSKENGMGWVNKLCVELARRNEEFLSRRQREDCLFMTTEEVLSGISPGFQ